MSETSEIYVPIEWLNHIIERPRTYTIMNNDDGTVTLTPAFGEITQKGTPVNAENLNHMEQGIIEAIRAAAAAQNTANTGVTNAAAAQQTADDAKTAAAAAQNTANTGVTNAAAAQQTADDAKTAAAAAQNTANTGVSNAAAAQQTADEAKTAAAAAQNTANTGVSNAATAQTAANGKIPKVSGATEGHIPTFKSDGTLASSGIAMSGFHRCKFSLSGTTLTITTVS